MGEFVENYIPVSFGLFQNRITRGIRNRFPDTLVARVDILVYPN
jgi:hypothetical protein